jgi:hypothetical protein
MYPEDSYTEDHRPRYDYVDESLPNHPRFLVRRENPSGRMYWGITSYKTRKAAQKAVDALNELALEEAP